MEKDALTLSDIYIRFRNLYNCLLAWDDDIVGGQYKYEIFKVDTFAYIIVRIIRLHHEVESFKRLHVSMPDDFDDGDIWNPGLFMHDLERYATKIPTKKYF